MLALLASACVVPAIGLARADAVCDYSASIVRDVSGAQQLVVVAPAGVAFDLKETYRKHFKEAVLDLLDLVPSRQTYLTWTATEPVCFYNEGTCAREAKRLTCNGSALCPSGALRYPLGATQYVRKFRFTRTFTDKLVMSSAAGLGANIHRAYPKTLAAVDKAMREAMLYTPDPWAAGIATGVDYDQFFCEILHEKLADLDQRSWWASVLVPAFNRMRDPNFEGINVTATSDLQVLVRRGANAAAIRLLLGELLDTSIGSNNGASEWQLYSLGAWPGGKLPVRVTPSGQPWGAEQWRTTTYAEHLGAPYAGFRAYPIASGLGEDWRIYILSKDEKRPSCVAKAKIFDDFHVEVTVTSDDDWSPGTVSAGLQGQSLTSKDGREASFVFQAPRDTVTAEGRPAGGVKVVYACVDAAGNRTSYEMTSEVQAPPKKSGESCATGSECEVGSVCFQRTCVQQGKLRISLVWSAGTDLDLHVQTPNGNEIKYSSSSADGGRLDVDDCKGDACRDPRGVHVENIVFLDNYVPGTYLIWIQNYSGTTSADFTIEAAGAASGTWSGRISNDPLAVSLTHSFAVP